MKNIRMKIILVSLCALMLSCCSVSYAVVLPVGATYAPDVKCLGNASAVGECPEGQDYVPPGIVFLDNFDDQVDWLPINGAQECDGRSVCPSGIPANWSYMRNIESWHPSTGEPTKKPGQAINADQYRGASGKSWIRYHESSKDPATQGNTWGDDTLIIKTLPQDYDELYASFWIKFDSAWQWAAAHTGIMKLFRFYHFDGPDGTAEPWAYFTDGDSAPIFLYDLQRSPVWGYRGVYALRCDPQESDYYCAGGDEGNKLFGSATIETPFSDVMGDGQWHRLEYRVKMNTAIGVSDGIMQVWMDGDLQFDRTDIPWRGAGSSLSNGWNTFGLGGNTTNWFSDPANKAEQWYAIDDFCIATIRDACE